MRHKEWHAARGCGGVLALLLAMAEPLAATPLSFSDALVRLQRHPALEANRARRLSAEAERDAARALYYPQVGLSGFYGRFSDPIEANLGPLNDLLHRIDPNLPGIPNPVLQPEVFGFAMAAVTWPVYTGGRVGAANRAGDAGLRAADAGHRAAHDALLLDLVARYHGVTLAARAAAVQNGVVDSLREHLRNARALEANGQISAADRMRVEVALAQAEAAQQQRRHALELAQAGLGSLLDIATAPSPTTPLGELTAPDALIDLQVAATGNNPLLQQLDAVERQAEQGVRAARGEYRPTVALVGGYKLGDYQLPELIPEWTVGATLTLPLFDGGARRAKVAGARARLREARALRREAADKVRLLVRERYLAYEDAHRRWEVAGRAEALASESLRLQRVAFREGVGRSVDVVDAENALAAARLSRLAARFDSVVAWTGLMLAAGRRGDVERVLSHPLPESDANVH